MNRLLLVIVLFAVAMRPAIAEEPPTMLTIDATTTIHIQLPSTPSETERYTAAELQRCLAALFGTTPTIGDQTTDAALHILLSAPDLHAPAGDPRVMDRDDDAYVLDIAESRIAIAGGADRGTFYGALDLLEQLGCRWLEPGPGGEYIRRRESAQLPIGTRSVRPQIAVRTIGTSGPVDDEAALAPAQISQTIDWLARNRLNRSFALRPSRLYRIMPADDRNPWARRGGIAQWHHVAHNTPFMVPNERYFESHPEYYSLYHGVRIPIGPESGYLCTTNPDLQATITAFADNWFTTHPGASVLPIIPPDGAIKWCECDTCIALGGRNFSSGADGRMTRRQVEFVNAIAADVKKSHPDRYLLNLAYSQYVEPYPGLKTADNVVVQVAHGYAGHGSFVRPISEAVNTEAREIFEQWAESGAAGIGVWDYFMLHVPSIGGSPRTPLGLSYVASDMMRYLAAFDSPYTVYFTQAGNELWQYNAFLYYAVARMAWQPDIEPEALMHDFATTVFGEHAAPAVAYLQRLDAAYREAVDWRPSYWGHITVPSPKVFTEKVMQDLDTQLTTLERTVPADDTQARHMLARWRASWDYVANTVGPKRLIGERGVWRLERRADGYLFNADADGPNADAVARVRTEATQRGVMDAALERLLFRAEHRVEPIVWLESERLRVGILPGVGGRIVRLIDRRSGLNLLHEPEVSELEDAGVGYFRYGGYEEYTQKYFASAGWEVPMPITDRVSSDTEMAVTMTAEFAGLRSTRRVSLSLTDNTLQITTKLTNLGEKPRPTMIRVHPEFSLGGDLDGVQWLYQTDAEAPLHMQALLTVADSQSHAPSGLWGAFNPNAEVAVIHHFDEKLADTHLHIDRAAGSFNLELFGKNTDLAPGASTSLSHTYEVRSGTAEVAALAALVKPGATTPPPEATWIPGRIGQAAKLTAGPLLLPALPAAIDTAGTVEAWIRLPDGYETGDTTLIWSFGTKQPDYMLLVIDDGHLVGYRQTGTPPYDGHDEAWAKLSGPIPEARAGTWHHVAMTWQIADGASSQMAIYFDGRPVDSRANLRIRPLRYAPYLAIAGNAAKVSDGVSGIAVDELRVSATAHDATAIAAAAKSGRDGKPLPLKPDTRALLRLDGDFTPTTTK